MNHYFVITPQYESFRSSYEPPEFGCDVVTVWATDKVTAKVIAIKSKELKSWVRDARSDERNPFTGLKVELCQCKHGKCYCKVCHEDCEICIEEAERQEKKYEISYES